MYCLYVQVAAEEVPLWIPLEQKVVKDVRRLNSSTYLTGAQIESTWAIYNASVQLNISDCKVYPSELFQFKTRQALFQNIIQKLLIICK